jgi:hypothetical protein
MAKVLTTRQRAIKAGYRSGLEETISTQLKVLKVPVKYETEKIKYEVNEVRRLPTVIGALSMASSTQINSYL